MVRLNIHIEHACLQRRSWHRQKYSNNTNQQSATDNKTDSSSGVKTIKTEVSYHI